MDHAQAFPFNEAVDWKKLNIPDYPKIIKKPMDLAKVDKMLSQGHYKELDDFAKDVRLVFTNARTYNIEFSDIHQMAKVVEAHFDEKFGKSFKERKKRKGVTPGADQGSAKRTKPADTADDLSMNNDRYELPEEPMEDKKTQPVTNEDKEQLQAKVRNMNSDDLGKMIDILRERCPSTVDNTQEVEVLIDVDAMGNADFRYIAKFVGMCTNGSVA